MKTEVIHKGKDGRSAKEHVTTKDVPKDQLAKGMEIEREHSSDPKVRREIALDHLAERKDYYTKLEQMEKSPLSKTAFDVKDSERLLQVIKNSLIKLKRPLSKHHTLSAVHKSDLSINPSLRGKIFDMGVGDAITKSDQFPAKVLREFRKVPEFSETVSYALQQKANAAMLDASNRKMVNAIIRGHEYDEATHPFAEGRFFSHGTPAVILREHNRVTTLPKEFDTAKKFMTHLRSPSSSDDLSEVGFLKKIIPGFEYGKSPRISRNLIKKLSDKYIDVNSIKTVEPDYFQFTII